MHLTLLSVPFSVVGGFWYLYLLHYNTSVAVWVGFIGLAGIAGPETGIVMIVYINLAIEQFRREGRMNSITDSRGDHAWRGPASQAEASSLS